MRGRLRKRSDTEGDSDEFMKRKTHVTSTIERFEALSDAAKEASVREFDQEFVADKSRPLTSRQKRQWSRFRKRVSAGHKTERVSIALTHELVEQSDQLAKEQGLSRTELIARSLRAALALAGK
jgi:Ribbon-helix-helix protein, copG family